MFKDDYKAAFSKVTASGETYRRVMQMTQRNNKKHRSVSGTVSKLLVAAVVVSLLAVTAAAAAENWFVPYFSGESESGPNFFIRSDTILKPLLLKICGIIQ